jgi:hypothetical protein
LFQGDPQLSLRNSSFLSPFFYDNSIKKKRDRLLFLDERRGNREEGKKEDRPNRNAWRRLYGEKTVRKAERAWFLSGEEESESLGINGARPHFLPGPIYSHIRNWLPLSIFFLIK